MKLLIPGLIWLVFSITNQAVAKSQRSDPEAALKAAVASGKPTLLEFGSLWCTSCARLDLTIKALRKEKEISDRVKFIYVDVDEFSDLASRHKIQSLPILIFINGSGKEIKRHFGFIEKEKLMKTLKDSFNLP